MNREIKFRFWDSKRGILYYDAKSSLYLFLAGHAGTVEYNGNFEKTIIPQQFTGLKDKNGKDIYEGDLVNFNLDECILSNEEVWYDNESCSFMFGKIYYDGFRGYHSYQLKDIEIVGNIFENPELIKP